MEEQLRQLVRQYGMAKILQVLAVIAGAQRAVNKPDSEEYEYWNNIYKEEFGE